DAEAVAFGVALRAAARSSADQREIAAVFGGELQPRVEERVLRAAAAAVGNRAGTGQMRDAAGHAQHTGRDRAAIQLGEKEIETLGRTVDAPQLVHEIGEPIAAPPLRRRPRVDLGIVTTGAPRDQARRPRLPPLLPLSPLLPLPPIRPLPPPPPLLPLLPLPPPPPRLPLARL